MIILSNNISQKANSGQFVTEDIHHLKYIQHVGHVVKICMDRSRNGIIHISDMSQNQPFKSRKLLSKLNRITLINPSTIQI